MNRTEQLQHLLNRFGEDFIHSLYAELLGRSPDAAGKASYLALLRSGVSKEEIVLAVARSAEARAREPDWADAADAFEQSLRCVPAGAAPRKLSHADLDRLRAAMAASENRLGEQGDAMLALLLRAEASSAAAAERAGALQAQQHSARATAEHEHSSRHLELVAELHGLQRAAEAQSQTLSAHLPALATAIAQLEARVSALEAHAAAQSGALTRAVAQLEGESALLGDLMVRIERTVAAHAVQLELSIAAATCVPASTPGSATSAAPALARVRRLLEGGPQRP